MNPQAFLKAIAPVARPVVVALSGGADSVALLQLFLEFAPHRLGGAAYLDHGLRPESGRDGQWLAEFCNRHQVAFYSKSADRTREAIVGVEANGREQRYRWFEQLAGQLGVCVATAHHADDVAETVLMKLFSGTSLIGLAGPRPQVGEWLIRPLLSYRSRDLADFLRARQLDWLEDSSNQDQRFLRNWVRHSLWPVLQQRFTDPLRPLSELAQEAQSLERSLRAQLPSPQAGLNVVLEPHWSETQVGLVLQGLWQQRFPQHPPRLSRAHLRAWAEFLRHPRADLCLQLPGNSILRWGPNQGFFWDDPQAPLAPQEVLLHQPGRFDWMGFSYRIHSQDPGPGSDFQVWSAQLGLDFPCKIRNRRAGDRWGSQKLKKKLIDWGVPSQDRDRLALLVDQEDRVLAVIGQAARPQAQSQSQFQSQCASAKRWYFCWPIFRRKAFEVSDVPCQLGPSLEAALLDILGVKSAHFDRSQNQVLIEGRFWDEDIIEVLIQWGVATGPA